MSERLTDEQITRLLEEFRMFRDEDGISLQWSLLRSLLAEVRASRAAPRATEAAPSVAAEGA